MLGPEAPAFALAPTSPADGPGVWLIVGLVAAAFLAGWVDAVVGGGGLVQLPVLLLVPGLSPIQAIATNKAASLAGTLTSSATYFRRIAPDLRTAVPMALVAAAGAAGGAIFASSLPGEVLLPIVLVALVVVAIYTVVRKDLGAVTALRYSDHRHLVLALGCGLGIGFYDGLIGPGTGSFLVFALVALSGYAFLSASATAKIVNAATNIGALVVFVPQGSVVWVLAIPMAAANVLGAYLGARTAISRGSRFVRIVFLVVVAVLIVRLGQQVLTG